MTFLNSELIVPGDYEATLHYAVEHFITTCRDAIANRAVFCVALSGGSTPKAIYELLCQPPYASEIEWDKVHLFWSDERAVPPTHPDSNYQMAMKAGFEKMTIPPGHIHRMVAESDIEANAQHYEQTLRHVLDGHTLDLVMLGMGDDGHTASLFPGTDGLREQSRLVTANYIPQKETWRMTLTFPCINDAAQTVFYVMGPSKAAMVAHVFSTPPTLPCQSVEQALWIVDTAAASLLSAQQ